MSRASTDPRRGASHAWTASIPEPASALSAWWPLVAITILAAALRIVTLGSQSLWYDEAFTPVHVLHAGLGATLSAVAHTENTPPLWYVLEWAVSRALGTGAVALRLISALAGVATVPVAWAIGRELAGRRAAILTAGLVAVNPLFVWYSQEARAYGLFVLTAALSMLLFVRLLREPTPGRALVFALCASLALLTHYFAVFLLVPMALWLLADRAVRARVQARAIVVAIAIPALVGAALVPLILAQAGHGTQWIGRWALSSRLRTIPRYYLTGYSGAPLGHGVELLIAMIALAGVTFGLWRGLDRREERGALIALTIVAAGVLIPIALALLGADYLAPRNLLAAMIPLTALLAIVIGARRAGGVGMMLAGLLALAFTALTIDVNLSPRLQRGDWAGLAAVLRPLSRGEVLSTVELGSAPLQYYLPGLRPLPRGSSVRVSELDETGYAPLRPSAGLPPAPGFHLIERRDVHGLIVYRFASRAPITVTEKTLRRHVITLAHPEVLINAPSRAKSI